MVIKRSPSRPLVRPNVSAGKTIHAMTPVVGFFLSFLWCSASDWPQWHGPTRDCHLPHTEPVASLPNDLKPVWKISIGGGVSLPVVAGGKLVYLHENGAQEAAPLIDPKTGKEIWTVPGAAPAQNQW